MHRTFGTLFAVAVALLATIAHANTVSPACEVENVDVVGTNRQFSVRCNLAAPALQNAALLVIDSALEAPFAAELTVRSVIAVRFTGLSGSFTMVYAPNVW
jgi:hypothetical protein